MVKQNSGVRHPNKDVVMVESSILKALFSGRKSVLATMHEKEKVIQPLLEKQLGLEVIIPQGFNTDSFGTFTNEVTRMGNQLEAARHKALKAMDLTGVSIGIASEGSFGPHPMVPFLPYNREIILFVDQDNGFELVGKVENSHTNFAAQTVRTLKEAEEFAEKVGFPLHGLIVKSHENVVNPHEIVKGIITKDKLAATVLDLLKKSPEGIFIQTDMRALYNPTRMENIESAVLDLIMKLKSFCPSCRTPGFEVSKVKRGLPCCGCGLPTELPIAYVYNCKKCSHQEEKPVTSERKFADPGQCVYCNP
jgi:hypothetical protein